MKISAVIIAKNEERMIADALESIKFCDEIIVINNDSTDKTKEVSEKFKAQVFEFTSSDFSELRNFGLSKTTGDYILYLDADERVSSQLKEEIKKVTSTQNDTSAFRLKRKNFYFGENEWPLIEKMERLFKKEALSGWKGKIHESPIVNGEVGDLNGFLLHFTHRDLESMLEKTIEWSDTEALTRYNTGHPKISWWRFPRVMLTAFLDSFIGKRGFRAGSVGVLESLYQSFSSFITYAKLWELQNKDKLVNKNVGNK